MQPIDSALAVVKWARPSITGLKILDIGCGTGNFAHQLAAEGAEVTGLDPEVGALQSAAATVPQATFLEGVAEALPFGNATFDICVMVNALHHVPEMSMQTALREAARVIRRDGVLIIIEPLSSGSFFRALRMIEDETEVRLAAQRAIETTILSGLLVRTAALNYVRREIFRTVERFLDRAVAVDPLRREVVERNGDAIAAAVLAEAHRDREGALIFDQPIRADILEQA